MTKEYGHILIVDDHRTSRMRISFAIKKLGHSVDEAADGQQALDMLRADVFDMVLLDIIMPGMNGYQVLKQMKADDTLRNIPVIVISALGDKQSTTKSIELGAKDYLPKSFGSDALKARIGACLEEKAPGSQEQPYTKTY